MRIIDLSPSHESLYFVCLEDWSSEIREAGNHKEIWYEKARTNGLRVKLAEDDSGAVGGMIQYLPIEHSLASGQDLYFIYCIWVHGYKQGRGDFRNRGMGKALLSAAEEDARALGAKGMAAWGISLPFFMRASWFKKHGYKQVDKMGIRVLLLKSFSQGATAPKWIRKKKLPETIPGKVHVSAFKNGWCPAGNLSYERAKRAVEEFKDAVVWDEYDTCDPAVFQEWGLSDALFVDGKEIRTGPPPSYEKLKRIIYTEVLPGRPGWLPTRAPGRRDYRKGSPNPLRT